jgi:hypothetical protein
MRRLRIGGLMAVLGLVVLAVAVGASLAAGSPPCQVVNGGRPTGSFAAAVRIASSGDTLVVSGTCSTATARSTVTIDKDLTISGGTDGGTLDGGGNGSVLTIDSGVTVTITNLTITNGYGVGGGIQNNLGTLTLNSSTISGNTSTSGGGGILNYLGTVTLDGGSIHSNNATLGGGIYNDIGTVTLSAASSIHDNNATSSGGGIINYGGTLNGAVAPATLCPTDTTGYNVYCNTPDNIVS